MTNRSPFSLLAFLVASGLSLAPSSARAEGTIAVPKMGGSKRTGVAKAAKAVRSVLRDEGYTVLGPGSLKKAGRRVGARPSSVEAAAEAGAELLIVGRAKKGKKKTLVLKLIDVETGDVIDKVTRKYRTKGRAARSGRSAIKALMPSIEEALEEEEEEPDDSRSAPVRPVAAADDTRDDSGADSEPPPEASRPVPKDEVEDEGDSGEVAATPGDASDGDAPTFLFRVGAGTQALSRYTVTVGDAPTALAYELGPLMLISIGATWNVANTGLGLEANFDYAPVKYRLDTEPAVSPDTPSGQFLGLGLALSYSLELSDAFTLQPVVGFRLESLGVQVQEPFAIVVGNSAIAPHFGARAIIAVNDNLRFGADVRLRWLPSYSESPQGTGESGSGLGTLIGGDAQYWLNDTFGASFGLGYEFTKVNMLGTGDRDTFENDPALVDASVFSSNLKVAVSALLAI